MMFRVVQISMEIELNLAQSNPYLPESMKSKLSSCKKLLDRLSDQDSSMIIYIGNSSTRKVSIRGIFTTPPWTVDVPMEKKGYRYQLNLKQLIQNPGTYIFKFLINDTVWVVDRNLPTSKDRDGILNNVIHIAKPPPPSLKPVRSLPLLLAQQPTDKTTAFKRLSSLDEASISMRLQAAPFELPGDDAKNGEHKNLELFSGAWLIPHPEKKKTADAMFFSKYGAGVSDSVSEWEWRFKIDPRLFAEELMKGCSDRCSSVISLEEDEDIGCFAKRILSESFDNTTGIGSATACVGAIYDGKIGVANLGDSTFMQFRRINELEYYNCILKTKEQRHTFNMPYQLTRLPPTIISNNKLDTPDKSDIYINSILPNDLLIFVSDGVLDNLWLSQITTIIAKFPLLHNPQEIAKKIATEAFTTSTQTGKNVNTPFSVSAKKSNHRMTHITGGKPDDITVVACWVVNS
jgi:protein phosphatase PTC7